jgi:hypothetical protein
MILVEIYRNGFITQTPFQQDKVFFYAQKQIACIFGTCHALDDRLFAFFIPKKMEVQKQCLSSSSGFEPLNSKIVKDGKRSITTENTEATE